MNETKYTEELMRILNRIAQEEQRSTMPECLQQWEQFYSQCPEYISEGGNWIVYKVVPKKPVNINAIQYDTFVLKIKNPQNNGDVSNTLSNYKLVSKAGLKTVSFLRRAKISDYAYECENINEPYRKKESTFLYVSPNTARYRKSEIHVLDPIFSAIGTDLIYTIKDFDQNITKLIKAMQESEKSPHAVVFSEEPIFLSSKGREDIAN